MASPKSQRRGARRPPPARRRRLAALLCLGAGLWAVLAMIAHLHVRVARLQRVEKSRRLPVRCASSVSGQERQKLESLEAACRVALIGDGPIVWSRDPTTAQDDQGGFARSASGILGAFKITQP